MTDPFGTRTEITAEEYLEYIRSGQPAIFLPPLAETPPDWQTSEKAFLAKVGTFAREHNWLTYHTWKSANSSPGFPDLVMARAGRIVAAELKVGHNTPTATQRDWLDALAENSGVETYVWYPVDWDVLTEVLT